MSDNEIDAHTGGTEENDTERVEAEHVKLGEGDVEMTPSEDAEEDFHPFDEVGENCIFGPIKQVYGADGLKGLHVPAEQTRTDIPHFNAETLICIGVFDKFVIRDEFGEITHEFPPDIVQRGNDGKYFIPWKALTQTQQASLWGAKTFVIVEPIRPPCKHYVRQMSQFEHNPENQVMTRLCSARRTTEGTFATVRDVAIWACDMRVPRDLASEKKHLDTFDEMKIKQGQDDTWHSMFKKEGGVR
jgi:hypothetical protein